MYFVVGNFSPALSADRPIEMSPGIFWVPASRLPADVAALWESGGQGELPVSGAFAVDAADMIEVFGIEQSKKYILKKRIVSEYLSVCALVTDLSPILLFTWATYIQRHSGQRVGGSTHDLKVYDYRIYGMKRYSSNAIEISEKLRRSSSAVLNLNRDMKVNRPLAGFLRGLESATRAVDPVIGFPTIWAALESIMRPGTGEITYKLAIAIAQLEGGQNKNDTYRAVKAGYKLRSDIVHGNSFDESNIADHGRLAIKYCKTILSLLIEESFSAECLLSLSVEALIERLLNASDSQGESIKLEVQDSV